MEDEMSSKERRGEEEGGGRRGRNMKCHIRRLTNRHPDTCRQECKFRKRERSEGI
jgi:hypothetical protein